MGWTTRTRILLWISQFELFNLHTFSEHERSTEMKYRDISIMFGLPPVLGVLRLAADRVADLSVWTGPVVVPGPHSQIGHRGTWSKVCNEPFSFSLQRPAYPQYSEQP